LKAFTAQVSIALENARLFEDVQNMRNYNESVLESMSNGVITLDEHGVVNTCNTAGYRLLRLDEEHMLHRPAVEIFADANSWVNERLAEVRDTGKTTTMMDAALEIGGDKLSVNITFLPLVSHNVLRLGTIMMIEDISSEKRMKSTMARYMDPGLADQLLADGGELLGGQSVEATVLFSDIRSFTTLTEELGAQGTVALLNEYFTVMVNCITHEGGMLDKFIGDAIMAEFGIPVSHGDDADRAVRAAISMTRELNEFNERRQSQGLKPLAMGVGLNTDTIVSGNIGSPKRMDYTVIGDGVNLASRLESACKQYGAHILASEFTYRDLKATYSCREIDRVVVKGKTEPVGIYEVLDFHTAKSFPRMHEVINHFRSGLGYYRKADFKRAIAQFREALSLHPGDEVARIYVTRCEYLIENPPQGDWDGVWVMESK
jgi:adenylate cyclase